MHGRYLSVITVDEFNALDNQERAAAAMQGTFLDVRLEQNLKVALYSLPGFYAEVFYHGEINQIVRSRAFTSIVHLAAYIHLD